MAFFKEVPCPKCKVTFGVTSELDAMLRQSCQTFYCPFGHHMSYSLGESEATKLRRERDSLKQEAARLEDARREERERAEAAERRASAARGQVARLKNRAAAGVCPCCNRSFENLRRHMASKHAGFTVEEVQAEAGQTIQ